MANEQIRGYNKLPLDVALDISPEEEEFFTTITKLDWNACKEHIAAIQTQAYHSIYAYPCIRSFNFCRFKVASHFNYPAVRKLGQEPGKPIFVDLGSCFGTDVRKVVLDGWKEENVLGTDLQPGFIELGYKLFLDESTCKIKFISGDIFDTSFYDPTSSSITAPSTLSSISNLNALRSNVRALHAGSFFHLFDEETQEKLAHIVFSLMNQSSGSTVFGSQVAISETSGLRGDTDGIEKQGTRRMFCHSPTSWTEMWKRVAGDKVVVDARLMTRSESKLAPPNTVGDRKGNLLLWSVTWK